MGLWSNVEARILAYIREGKLNGLPGEGRPLPPDPADGLPAEARFEVMLARSVGHVPEEVALMKEIAALRAKIDEGQGDLAALRAELTDRSLRLSLMHEANGRYLSALLAEHPREQDDE
jgi:hypothetical protein